MSDKSDIETRRRNSEMRRVEEIRRYSEMMRREQKILEEMRLAEKIRKERREEYIRRQNQEQVYSPQRHYKYGEEPMRPNEGAGAFGYGLTATEMRISNIVRSEADDRIIKLEKMLAEYVENSRKTEKIIDDFEGEVRRLKTREDEKNNKKMILKMVTIKDRLNLVVNHFSKTDGVESQYTDLYSAVELINDDTRDLLLEQGASELIPAKGSKFDASIHEVSRVSKTDSPEEDLTIVSVSRAGYMLSDNVIRPPLVTIKKYELDEKKLIDRGDIDE